MSVLYHNRQISNHCLKLMKRLQDGVNPEFEDQNYLHKKIEGFVLLLLPKVLSAQHNNETSPFQTQKWLNIMIFLTIHDYDIAYILHYNIQSVQNQVCRGY